MAKKVEIKLTNTDRETLLAKARADLNSQILLKLDAQEQAAGWDSAKISNVYNIKNRCTS